MSIKSMKQRSWKTSFAGTSSILLSLASIFIDDPNWKAKFIAASAVIQGGGLLASRDNNRSDEQVNAGGKANGKPKDP